MDLRGFDLNLLRVLDVLLAERSVTAAGARLNLSQPAVSAALSRLRARLDDPLLVRRGNRLILSPRAERLQSEVHRLMGDIQRTLDASGQFDPRRDEQRFKIAATDAAVLVILLPLFRQLTSDHAKVALDIFPIDERLEERLATGVVDLAIGPSWPLRMIEHRTALLQERFAGLVRRDHPGLPDPPTLDAYVALDHILVSYRGRVPGVVDCALAKLGRCRRVAMTVPDFLLAPQIVAGSDLVLTIDRWIAAHFAARYELRLFEPPLELPNNSIAMAWHGRTDTDPRLVWLRSQIEIACDALKAVGPEACSQIRKSA